MAPWGVVGKWSLAATRGEPTITSARASTHELHSRLSDGLRVRLLWLTPDDRLFVTVSDSKHDQEFCVEVHDRKRALDVFRHPFAQSRVRT
jgi:hypothetical protein